MDSRSHLSSSHDGSEEVLSPFRNNTTSSGQNGNTSTGAGGSGPTNVSGPRARKPTQRLSDEITSKTNSVGATMEDPEDLTSDLDDREGQDSDYNANIAQQKPRSGKLRKSSLQPMVASLADCQTEVARLQQKLKEQKEQKEITSEIRKKRTHDRKLLFAEKAKNKELGEKIGKISAKNQELIGQLREAKEDFEAKLDQQQTDFDAAQAALTKLLKKDESRSITDDVVRDELKRLKSEWRPWARDYACEAFPGCPEAVIRELIVKTTKKTASERDSIFQDLAVKSSGPAICLNALLAFNVCEKTFGDPFLGLITLEGGHGFKENNDKFLSLVLNGDVAKASSWRAQTLQLVDFSGGIELREDRSTLQAACDARLRQHYASLAANFLDHIALGMLKSVDEAEAVKRREELEAIYQQAGDFSIQLGKQKSQMHVDFSGSLKDIFSRRSDTMHPHPSMLLDEDDISCDGRLPDMVIEPGLYAYGDAQGRNYTMRKNWMKATVLLFDKRPEQEPQTLNKAEELEPQNAGSQNSAKHTIIVEDDEQERQTKRMKITAPRGDIDDAEEKEEARRSAATSQEKPSSEAPRTKPSDAGVKAAAQKKSTADGGDPKNGHARSKASASTRKSSKAEPAKKTTGSKLANISQQNTASTANTPRAPPPTTLRTVMGNQATIPQMSFLNQALTTASQPKDTHAMQKEKDRQAREAIEVLKQSQKTAKERGTNENSTDSNGNPESVSWPANTPVPERLVAKTGIIDFTKEDN